MQRRSIPILGALMASLGLLPLGCGAGKVGQVVADGAHGGELGPPLSDGLTLRDRPAPGREDAGPSFDGASPGDGAPPTADGGQPDLGGPGVGGQTSAYACTKTGSAPRGGGEGYGDWVPSKGAGVELVSTKAALLAALKTAKSGTVIYVADGATIDLSSEKAAAIEIRAGLTLASGRGRNGSLGALIRTSTHDTSSGGNGVMFRVVGSPVRITGLRVRGPDTDIAVVYQSPLATGIFVRPKSGTPTWDVEIDNNELLGWPSAAVSVSGVKGVRVHHNDMHHNQRARLGYGVVTSRADPVIGSNVFNLNRHAIASTGYPGSSYEACHNIVLPGANGHAFDMHGGFDKGFFPDAAGASMSVHHNTFLISSYTAVLIRGVPELSATVRDNSFVHPALPSGSPAAVGQRFWPKAPGCLSGGGCVLTPWPEEPGYQKMADKEVCRAACSPSVITADPKTFDRITLGNNLYGQPSKSSWMICFGATGHWLWRRFSGLAPSQIAVGDFDGDGADDVFHASGSAFYGYRSARFGGAKLSTAADPISSLALGDFDGDGKTDVLRTTGGKWWLSSAGTASFKQLNTSGYTVGSLGFGDFDGDGKTDIFRADGSQWWVSWGGSTGWKQLNVAATPLSALGFGDFDGDGKTDVFHGTGSAWRFSPGGSKPWSALTGSSYTVASLAFGDFDGDGKTDVFRADGGKWHVSYGGASSWKVLNSSSVPIAQLAFGDFNGDGKTDVLSRQ